MVSDRIIKIGITQGPVELDNMISKLFTFPCYCDISQDHPLAMKKALTPKDLNQQPVYHLGSGAHDLAPTCRNIYKKINASGSTVVVNWLCIY